MTVACDLVIGIGEIGGPLADMLALKRNVVRKDIGPLSINDNVEVMHICFPYSETFTGMVMGYISEYVPLLTIIHSTVVPGTVRAIAERVQSYVAYSPVRGRHTEMRRDLIRYTKFVAAPYRGALQAAVAYFDMIGLFHVETMGSCKALELAKLIGTSYYGLLIAWAQEVSRYCDVLGVDYEDVLGFTREAEHLPRVIFHPGHIKGHCVMPNLDLLELVWPSSFIAAIRASNEMCTEAQKADITQYQARRI